MLKILVCVKQVPDVDLVTMDPETGNLVREGVPTDHAHHHGSSHGREHTAGRSRSGR